MIRNNAITGNSAGINGGGLATSDATIENNTIVGNSAERWGGGLFSCKGTIRNCIIWGNTAQDGHQLYSCFAPSSSCVQGSDEGEGNIADDPQFVDPDGSDNDPQTFEDNNYRLSAGSPCIDKGKNEPWMVGAADLDGNPRVFYGGLSLTVDMGAYEYGSWPFRITQLLLQATDKIALRWESRPGEDYVIWSSTDLTSAIWVQEQTVSSAGDSTSWTDPSPGGSRKFYRV